MEKPPLNSAVDTDGKSLSDSWAEWFNKLWIVGGSQDNSGVTADRPTKNLFVGRPYFDTTLGYPIWLKSVRPTVWCNSSGTSV